jgi:hypothetical protein
MISTIEEMFFSKKQKTARSYSLQCIGLDGFEPSTPCPPDMYAKPLRYSPLINIGELTIDGLFLSMKIIG